MKEGDIRKYATLMKELELTGLEIEMDGAKVRLERGGVAAPVAAPIYQAPVVEEKKEEPKEDKGDLVTSPMVGVFYSAPAENAEPFVKIGSKVKKGDVLCIIEAMKLMNEIEAEFDGTVEEIIATNGQVVGFGADLFRIRRA